VGVGIMSNRLPEFLRNIEGMNELPVGFIARFEPHHQKFFNGHSPVKYLLLKINDANRLLKNKKNVDLIKDYKIITTTTIEDRKLEKLKWETERDIVLKFEPDFHIPVDYPVYLSMDEKDRISNISECMEGTKWMAKELSHTKTKILPLIKGITRKERSICYKTFDELKINYCVFYGSQYFGSGIGNQFSMLEDNIRKITSEYPMCGILLIGLLATRSLIKLPPQVVAAAGNKWVYECTKDCSNIDSFNVKLQELKSDVESTLCMGQMSIPMNWRGS